ncbi:MAG TPA: tetratricopeptide repeat protein [Candidatus Sulfotelmatobacter sp.]|nr:tetratricopeptide repeat protein [Candidatus Sulfotelmatobacter sp.]
MKNRSRILKAHAAFACLVSSLLLYQSVLAQKTAVRLPSRANHLQQGMLLARNGKWADAESQFRIAHQNAPDSTEAEVGHAEALVRIGQPFDAALELQSFLRDHPDSARAHEFYAVVTLSISNDFLLAQAEMEKCVKLEPNDGKAWKSLGDIYLDHTTPQDAIGAYRKAARLLPYDPLVVASLADAYSQAGDALKAQTMFAKAIKMTEGTPGSAESVRAKAAVQYMYGRYLLSQGRAKESVTATTRALSYNPGSTVALYNRARASIALGDYKSAEADALHAFELGPRDKQGPLLLIDIYRKEQDPDKAQKYAELAQKLVDQEQERSAFGREVRSLLGLAESALKQGKFTEAIPPYEELIKKVPTFYEAYFGLGMSYGQTGRLADAEASLRKYLSFQPVSGDGHAALGVILLQLQRGPEAVPELKQALQIDPSLDEARKALASEYIRESKLDDSVRTLRAAKDTKDTQLMVMLASVLAQKGDTTGALSEIHRALLIQPDDPDALRVKQEILSKTKAAK